MKKCSSTAHGGMFRALCLLLAAVMLMGMFWAGTAVSASAEEPAAETQYGYKTVSQTGDYVHFDVSGIMPKDAELKMGFVGQDYFDYVLATLGKSSLAENEFLYIYDLSLVSPTVESIRPADEYAVQFYLNEANISVDNMGVIPVASYNDFLASQAAKAAADAEKAQEELAAPADEAKAPAEDAAATVEEVAAPVEDVAAPAEPVAAPVEEVTAPAEAAPAADTAETESASAPADTAAPAESAEAADAEAPAEEADAEEAETEEAPAVSVPAVRTRAASAVSYSADKSAAWFNVNALGTYAIYGTKFDRTAQAANGVLNAPAMPDDAMTLDLPDNDFAVEDDVVAEEPADEPAPIVKYNVQVNFVFGNGDKAAEPWIAEVEANSALSAPVPVPDVLGYYPTCDQLQIQGSTIALNIDQVTGPVAYDVIYLPAEVGFTVKHYFQNIDDDGYAAPVVEHHAGLTGTSVGAGLAKTEAGFASLFYDADTAIAADGSTVIEIYYDRLSYLMSFDMDGGYGTEPVYARYGAAIGTVNTPTRAGYDFVDWSLNGSDVVEVPATMPAENRTYKAIWQVKGDVNVSVVIWGENADDEGYSYIKTVNVTATPGTSYTYTGNANMANNLWTRVSSDTVTVAADGSSVVNVYFDRKEFTLTFRNNVTVATIKAKWGAAISGEFNKAPFNTTYNGRAWKCTDSSKYGYALQTLDRMPQFDASFNLYNKSSETLKTIYYYLENVDANVSHNTWPDDNRNFTLLKQVQTYFNYATYNEEYHEIEGFTRYSRQTARFNIINKKDFSNNRLYLYYLRNDYELTFNDGFKNIKTESVQYEKNLGSYDFAPTEVPAAFEPGSVEFGGWYLNPEGTGEEYILSQHTMPAGNVILYAKWVPVDHTVRFFNDTDCTVKASNENGEFIDQTVAHGSAANDPGTPVNGNYTFVGWFYKDGETEKAFDLSMPVTKDLDLYAKWASNTPVKYIIHYQLVDGTPIARDTTGTALPGNSKTFDAKAGMELYAGYQDGCFPRTKSHTLEVNIDETKNEWTFVYEQVPSVPYTVKYLDKATNEPVAPEKHEVSSKAIVTETFVYVPNYVPETPTQRLVLEVNGENVLIFYYTTSTTDMYYAVRHYIEKVDGSGYELYTDPIFRPGKIGEGYSADKLTLTGFVYNPAPAVDKQDSEHPAHDAIVSLSENEHEINFYYDREVYPYLYKFIDQTTGEEIANRVAGEAKFQSLVKEEPAVIPGYTCVYPNYAGITIRVDQLGENREPARNVHTYLYTQNDVKLNYVVAIGEGSVAPASETVKAVTGTANGSVPTPAEGYHFVGWYLDEACTQEVNSTWVDDNNKIVPTKAADAVWVDGTTYYAKFERNDIKLTITKTVSGNFGDKTKEFPISVKVGGVEMFPDGDTTGKTATYHDKVTYTYTIPYGQGALIQEDATVATGYDMYVTISGEGEKEELNSIKSILLKVEQTQADEVTVEIRNHKDREVDTGINLDTLPYILVLAVVVAGAVVIIVRKHRRSYDD